MIMKRAFSLLIFFIFVSFSPIFIKGQSTNIELSDPPNDLLILSGTPFEDFWDLTETGSNKANDVISVSSNSQQLVVTFREDLNQVLIGVFLGTNLKYNNENIHNWFSNSSNIYFFGQDSEDLSIDLFYKSNGNIEIISTVGSIQSNRIIIELSSTFVSFNSGIMSKQLDPSTSYAIDLINIDGNGFDILEFIQQYWLYLILGILIIIAIAVFISNSRRRRRLQQQQFRQLV